MTTTPPVHQPVMLTPMLAALAAQAGEVYVDGTFGAGGYSTAILQTAPCRIIAFDRDPDSRARYDALPAGTRAAITLIDAPFSRLTAELANQNIQAVNGVVLDLGVSSPQLDTPERGFSFRHDGPLDMRMDPRTGQSAADVVNTASERDLGDILYIYGEERQSRSIARAILKSRAVAPITTTLQLATIVRGVVHQHPKDASDPATRSFQALRLYVNHELDELASVLDSALEVLAPQGRLVVVTFHSLEDRLVKQFMTRHSNRQGRPSRHMPDTDASEPLLTLPPTRMLTPDDTELRQNPRARSAKLRVAIRTATPYTNAEAA